MFQHLKTAVNEIVSAAELVLRTPESVPLLEQASELLDLARSAVDDDQLIDVETNHLKSKIKMFVQVILAEADFSEVQHCFQDMLNCCALIEDRCNEQTEPSSSLNNVTEQENQNIDMSPDALHCLQRQILGLGSDGDREQLNEAGLAEYINNSRNKVKQANIPLSNLSVEEGHQNEKRSPLRLWPKIINNAREFGQQNQNNGNVHTSRISGSDDADKVGEMGQYLNGILGCLERTKDRKRALETTKRLPCFARRDAVVAIRKHQKEIETQGVTYVEDLTLLLQNGVLNLLNETAMMIVCDALESLAIAWQCHLNSSVGPSSSKVSGSLLEEAKQLVDQAMNEIQANSRRRRVALASASMKSSMLTNETDGDSVQSVYSVKESANNKSFDVYGRDPTRKVGSAAREIGKQRKRDEIGSIHLSRHCSYEPSFHDISGLAVGTSQAKLEVASSSERNSSKLNTSSVFRGPPKVTKWKLSPPPPNSLTQPLMSASSQNRWSSKVTMVSPQLF